MALSKMSVWCGLLRRGDTPHRAADIIGNQQRALLVYCDTHGAAMGRVAVDKPGQHILGHAGWLTAGERHEHHLVAIQLGTIPTAMLANEGAALVMRA